MSLRILWRACTWNENESLTRSASCINVVTRNYQVLIHWHAHAMKNIDKDWISILSCSSGYRKKVSYYINFPQLVKMLTLFFTVNHPIFLLKNICNHFVQTRQRIYHGLQQKSIKPIYSSQMITALRWNMVFKAL